MRHLLASSRYLIVIAVFGAFLTAVAVIVYGGITVVQVVVTAFTHGDFSTKSAKQLAIEAIKLIDLFLLGTVLYIVALGLYDLFIDDRLPMPPWLHITTLDDLKAKLVGVVVVLLGVTFLGEVVAWNGDTNILPFGVAIALVIVALNTLPFFNPRGRHNAGTMHEE